MANYKSSVDTKSDVKSRVATPSAAASASGGARASAATGDDAFALDPATARETLAAIEAAEAGMAAEALTAAAEKTVADAAAAAAAEKKLTGSGGSGGSGGGGGGVISAADQAAIDRALAEEQNQNAIALERLSKEYSSSVKTAVARNKANATQRTVAEHAMKQGLADAHRFTARETFDSDGVSVIEKELVMLESVASISANEPAPQFSFGTSSFATDSTGTGTGSGGAAAAKPDVKSAEPAFDFSVLGSGSGHSLLASAAGASSSGHGALADRSLPHTSDFVSDVASTRFTFPTGPVAGSTDSSSDSKRPAANPFAFSFSS